jgi:hypothetical protein
MDAIELRCVVVQKLLVESDEDGTLLRGTLGAEFVRGFWPGLEAWSEDDAVTEEAVKSFGARSLRRGSEARRGSEDLARFDFDLCCCKMLVAVWTGERPTSLDVIISTRRALLSHIDVVDPTLSEGLVRLGLTIGYIYTERIHMLRLGFCRPSSLRKRDPYRIKALRGMRLV